MSNKIYSVDDIANILDMHPKTVQRYIREGKIKASKLGKAWRITEIDFKAFIQSSGLSTPSQTNEANASEGQEKPASIHDHIKVSSVVDISVKSTDDAINIANILTATLGGKSDTYGPSTMNIQFIEPENKVRVMLWGNVKFMEDMMNFMSDYLDNYVG